MKFWFDTEFLEDGKTVELISIGVVAEDGRELYLEAELDKEVLRRIYEHEWLMANVWPHLSGHCVDRDRIAHELLAFVGKGRPEFWGHCSAYDWVVINQLFGSMVEHPKNWPYWCNDLSQYAMHLGLTHRDFPIKSGTIHNALDDARWARNVWKFLHYYEQL